MQPFGRHRYGPKMGAVPFRKGGVGPILTQCGQGRDLPASQVSSGSIQPFGHNTPTLQTDRQDRQADRQTDIQQFDSIGRTVLQTVAQQQLECGPMPNLIAAQPNIGGVLCESSVLYSIRCTTPQSLAHACCWSARVPCSNAANIGERKTWTQ